MATAQLTASRAHLAAGLWWVPLIQGIASILIGVFLLTDPAATILTLAIFLGVYWLIGGVLDLAGVFIDRANWGWKLVSGVLGILAGLVVVRNPLWAGILVPAVLVWVMGVLGIVVGVVQVVHAVRGAGWGVGILGAVSIVFGALLVANPLLTTIVLIPMVAAWAVVGGILEIIFAFRLCSA